MTLKMKLAAGVFCALACMPMVAETAPKSDTMHRWEVTSKDTGGTLLFSDSPEYVDRPGILYQDTVNGEVRVLYYHLNNTKVPQKVAVVLENANSEEKYNIVQVTRGGTAKPSEYYLWVGKNTQRQYFGEKELDLVLLLKNRKRLLQSGMDEIVLQPGELVYGVYDFKVDHPVKTSVIMYPAKADPVEFIEKAKVLPRDSVALRGTYKGMDRVITSEREYDPERDGIVYIMLADNKLDKYKNGKTYGGTILSYGLGIYQMDGDSTARFCKDAEIDLVGHTGEAFGLLSMLCLRPNTKDGYIYIMNGEAVEEDEDERSAGKFSNNYIWEERLGDAICRHAFSK
jgi:hypothetical protein